MDILNQTVNALSNVPTSTWHAIGAFLATSTAIAGLIQILKHKLNIAEAKKLLAFLLGLFSFLASFATYILQQNANQPLPNIGKLTFMLVGAATLIHRFAVSPAYYKVAASLSNLQSWLDKVSAYQASQKAGVATPSVAEPADEANLSQFQV